ncbi:MAG: hypothetical protein N4A35_12830 [Flavobacteriales bacterium]|jgi:hypothetical protein|nr:hypothetical protein [Flavobacteriales bacterium]
MKNTFFSITAVLISSIAYSQSQSTPTVERKNLSLTPITIKEQAKIKDLPTLAVPQSSTSPKEATAKKQVADEPKQKK